MIDYTQKVRAILEKRCGTKTEQSVSENCMLRNDSFVKTEQSVSDVQYAHVYSYGCQQNVSDGEKIKGMLALMGYAMCDSPDEADIVIYNTCAIRENAEKRVFGNIGDLTHVKRRKPNMLIGLCGCMPQQEHIAQKIKRSYPHVDLVFGTHVLHRLPELIYKAMTQKKRIFNIDDTHTDIVEGLPINREQSYKASLPIMYGCNNFCTYCIVPYVRGRERSRKSADIIAEFRGLVAQGYREITLLGQNVNSYGNGLTEDINFAKLLRMLDGIEGDFRIRFMSSHPKDATFELIDTIAECPKVCKHLHLPIQSGSDKILSLMNRRYTVQSYLKLVEYARKRMPDIAFTSDIIVGFPGETYEDFRETVKLIERVRFDSIFSFIYSKREGTKAAEMADTIDVKEKSRWFSELLAAQKAIGKEKYRDCVDKTYRILVDGEGKTGSEYMTGRNEFYMIVDFLGDECQVGQFVDVKITKALNWALLGEPV